MDKKLKDAVSDIEQIRKGEGSEKQISDMTIEAVSEIVQADKQLDKDENETIVSAIRRIPIETYSRIVGYFRPIKNWNRGKAEEEKERKYISAKKISSQMDRSKDRQK